MKAVQIGDWLQHANGKYYQVKRIDRLGDGNIHFACGFPYLWEYNNKFEPIPLTTEILEKNGFEKQWQDNYEYFDDDENLNITFHPKNSNYTNGAYYYIDIERGCLTINEMPIAFVHELQHALRLCGITREIII